MNRTRWIFSSLLACLLTAFLSLQFLPLPQALTQTTYATMLLARDGSLLGGSIAADQQWRFAPVTALPEKYQQALLLFEDQHFYQHPGINPFALARAFYGNYAAGKVTSGGSTLSMQLARLLRQADYQSRQLQPPVRNLSSKLVEAARVLTEQPQAMQLRYLQTLTDIAGEKNSTIVFPLPMDLIEPLLNKLKR